MVLRQILQQLAKGLGAVLPGNVQLTVLGTSYTAQSLVAAIEQVLSLFDAVDQSKKQYQVAVKQLHAAVPGARQLVAGIGSCLRGQLGPGSPLLSQLGLKTGARKKPTSQKKAAAAAGGQLTRKARHVLGKVQRLSLSAPVKASVQILGPDGKPIQSSGSAPAGSGTGAGSGGSSTGS
ncbi:MAG: hypothetical protein ACYCWW_10680 [Deltaproteobacteria bacterium]